MSFVQTTAELITAHTPFDPITGSALILFGIGGLTWFYDNGMEGITDIKNQALQLGTYSFIILLWALFIVFYVTTNPVEYIARKVAAGILIGLTWTMVTVGLSSDSLFSK